MARYKFQTKNPSVRVGEEYTDYVLTDRNAKTTVDFSSVKINTTFSGIDFEFKKDSSNYTMAVFKMNEVGTANVTFTKTTAIDLEKINISGKMDIDVNNSATVLEGDNQVLYISNAFAQTIITSDIHATATTSNQSVATASCGLFDHDGIQEYGVQINAVGLGSATITIGGTNVYQQKRIAVTVSPAPEGKFYSSAEGVAEKTAKLYAASPWGSGAEPVNTVYSSVDNKTKKVFQRFHSDEAVDPTTITINVNEDTKGIVLNFSQTVPDGVTVDFGDGQWAYATSSDLDVSIQYFYSSPGTYTIKLTPQKGCELSLGKRGSTGERLVEERRGRYSYALLIGLHIGGNVVELFDYALCTYYNYDKELNIPSNVKRIGDMAIAALMSFNSPITIEEGVETIGKGFLAECHAFNQNVTIPDSVESIGDMFLASCHIFNSMLTIGSGLNKIPDEFLMGCYAYNYPLEIPSNIITIGTQFMTLCSSFNQPLTIPNSVMGIGYGFMSFCDSFFGPIFANTRTGVAPHDDPSGDPFGVSLCVSNTDADAYYWGLTIYGSGSQTWRTALSNLNDGPYRKLLAPTTYGRLFYWDNNNKPQLYQFRSINDLSRLENGGGYNTSIYFAGGITVPKDNIFGMEFGTETPTTIGSDFCAYCRNFHLNLVIPNTVTSISIYFLSDCDTFNGALKLSDNLTSIGSDFMYYCYHFDNPMIIPDGITTLESGFMQNCIHFDSDIKLPKNLKTIGRYVFDGIYDFSKELILPEGLESIGYAFFRYCEAFKNGGKPLVIPESITHIDDDFLEECWDFVGPIIANTSTTPEGESLAVESINNDAYRFGVVIKGPYADEWVAALPNLDGEDDYYRKIRKG